MTVSVMKMLGFLAENYSEMKYLLDGCMVNIVIIMISGLMMLAVQEMNKMSIHVDTVLMDNIIVIQRLNVSNYSARLVVRKHQEEY